MNNCDGYEARSSVQVLDRAFTILEVISQYKNGILLTELARQVSLPLSTVHRILSSMLDQGYILQDQVNGKYKLGLKFLLFSKVILEGLDLHENSRPFLRRMANEMGVNSALFVLSDNEGVCIENADSGARISVLSAVGEHVPVHATAAGKVLLCEMEPVTVIKMLKKEPLKRFTGNTIDNIYDFLLELARVRRSGYAYENEEYQPGVRRIAAPVRNFNGEIVAAVNLSGPIIRIAKDTYNSYCKKIIECAMDVSYSLGYSERVSHK